MIEEIGKAYLGENGREVLGIFKACKPPDGFYYFMTVTDVKSNQIVYHTNVNRELLQTFVKVVNDARLNGVRI